MKSLIVFSLLISATAFAAEIEIQESGVGSGLNSVSACAASDRDAETRAMNRCDGTITSYSCSRAPTQFGNEFRCISMCEFTCQLN